MGMKINRFINSVLFVSVVIVATGCPKAVNITALPPVITDQDSCAAACENLKRLGCKEGLPVDMGTMCKFDTDCLDVYGAIDTLQTCSALGSCMTVCTNFCHATEDHGVWLDPVCVSKVQTCDAIDSCPIPTVKQPTDSCTGPACKLSPGK